MTSSEQHNFAVMGAAGYIAPRHIKAIKETGNLLKAAMDPHDSVGILDKYFTNVQFFTELERFDRYLEKRRRGPEEDRIEYISICTPNYLHDAHIRLALRTGAHAICEKPIVINPWNLDALEELEREYERRVFTVLQLRVHPALLSVKEQLGEQNRTTKHLVNLTYVTARGPWYRTSWKGSDPHSGGLATNIGIHLFDLLVWFFGNVQSTELHVKQEKTLAGFTEFAGANVRWFLSIDDHHLPFDPVPGVRTTYRSIEIDGEEVEFTRGFTDLHSVLYMQTLNGHGFGIDHARPSVELVHRIRHQEPVVNPECEHELCATVRRT
ncbi:MAG TPA: Gfo/Idh/MocA family oxidoreductase [bacterium]|nr:Gfo/Idh/MocA family oxidoreductase [bacterium]